LAKLKYGTFDFFNAWKDEVNKDEAMARSKLTTTLAYVYSDRRGAKGQALTYIFNFNNGKITDLREGSPDEKVEIKFTANYDIWVKIIKGELNPMTAIMQGTYEMDAPMERISAYQAGLSRTAELIKEMDVDF
jgi:putative sterol carrier protein